MAWLPSAVFAYQGVCENEEFSGARDADDHFGFALCKRTVAQVGEAWVEPAGDIGDEVEDRAEAGSTAANAAPAMAFAAVVGDGSRPGQFGDSFVRDGADLGKFGKHSGDAAVECRGERIGVDERGDLFADGFVLTGEERDDFAQTGPIGGIAGDDLSTDPVGQTRGVTGDNAAMPGCAAAHPGA